MLFKLILLCFFIINIFKKYITFKKSLANIIIYIIVRIPPNNFNIYPFTIRKETIKIA